jgi:hypothetical protein
MFKTFPAILEQLSSKRNKPAPIPEEITFVERQEGDV